MRNRAARILALFATAYLVVVLFAAGWADYIDVTLLHSQREHVAPDILLLILTLPLSSLLNYLYDAGPDVFSNSIVQVGGLTVCGLDFFTPSACCAETPGRLRLVAAIQSV